MSEWLVAGAWLEAEYQPPVTNDYTQSFIFLSS
jgi:hypothetical protein